MPNPRDKKIREAQEKHLRAVLSQLDSLKELEREMHTFDVQVASGTNLVSNYFYQMTDEEFNKKIELYAATTENTDAFFELYGTNKNRVKIAKHVDGITKGLFAPVTDGSGLRQTFEKEEYKKTFADEQKRIDSAKIGLTAGVTEQMATLACMGFTLTDSNIEKAYDMAIKVPKGSGTSLMKNGSKADGGRMLFFSNMIAGNDDRGNANFPRLVVRQARSNTMSAIQAFSKGNKKPLANAIYETFVICHNWIANNPRKDDTLYYYCIDTMKQCMDSLQESNLIDEIYVDPQKVEMYEFLSKEAEFYDDYHKTKDELLEISMGHLLDENSINANQDPSLAEKKPLDDPNVARLYQRYAAMEYIQHMNKDLLNKNMGYLFMNGGEDRKKEYNVKRPFNLFENLSANQKDIFIDAVIEKIIKPNKLYQNLSKMNWREFMVDLDKCGGYTIPAEEFEVAYRESIKCLESVKIDHKEDPAYKDIIADIDEMLVLDKKLNENGSPSLEVLKENILEPIKKIDGSLRKLQRSIEERMLNGDANASKQLTELSGYAIAVQRVDDRIDRSIAYRNHTQGLLDEFKKRGGDVSVLENGGRISTEVEDRFLEETKLSKDYVGQIAKSYGLSVAEYVSKVEDNANAKGLSKAQYLEIEHYKALFKENQKLIKRVFPNNPELLVDDSEIDKYVNPETIAMHKQALQKQAEDASNTKQAEGLGVPDMFKRNYQFMRPRTSAADAEKLKKMDALIGQHSPEADELRKDLVVEWTNKIMDIDSSKVHFGGNFAEVAKYCMDNMDVFEVGWEYQNMQENFLADGGFDISEKQRENLKKIQDKGVVLGGIARAYKDMMTSELFLTLPFDKFNKDSFKTLTDSFDSKQRTASASLYGYMSGYEGLIQSEFAEPEKKISKDDLENKRVSPAELKAGLQTAKEALDDLSKANPDIAELPQIIESVNKSLELLDGSDAFMPQNSDKLFKQLSETMRLTSQSKNIPQAETLGNMLKGCCGKRFNFDSCMETWSDAVAEEYYGNINYSQEELNAKELFEQGLKITDELYNEFKPLEDKEAQSIKDNTSLSKEESFELHVKKSIWNARDELTAYAGRTELDMEKIKPMLAQVVFGMDYYNGPHGKNLSEEHYDAYIRQMADSPAFNKAVTNMTPADLNALLAKRDIGPEFVSRGEDKSLDFDGEKETLRQGIAKKFIQAKLEAMQGCKNPEIRAKAASVLSDEGKIEVAAKDIRNSSFFREMFDKPDVSVGDLSRVVNQSPKTLLKALQGTYDNSLKGDMDIFDVQRYIKDHAPNSEKIKNAFFDKWIVEGHSLSEFKTNNPHNLREGRSGLVSLTVSKMLEQGYSFENIMNPDVLKEERAAAFSEITRLAFDNSEDSRKQIGKLYALGAKTGLEYAAKLVDSADLSDPSCFMKKGNYFITTINNFVTDCKQEIEHSNQIRPYAEAEFGGREGYVKHALAQTCMSELIIDTHNAVMDANALQYGCNNKTKMGVIPSKFAKDIMKSKFEREAFMKAKKLDPKKNALDIAATLAVERKDLLFVNDIIVNQDIVQPLEASLKDTVASKALGKMYLSGKLDKSYKIKENTQKGSQKLFDVPDFKKTLNSLPKEAVQKSTAL